MKSLYMGIQFDASRVTAVSPWTSRKAAGHPTPNCLSLMTASLVLHLPIISSRSLDEWIFRTKFCELIGWEWAWMPHDSNGNVVYPTTQDIINHAGLRVIDSTSVKRPAWVKKMASRIENKTMTEIERRESCTEIVKTA